MVLLRLSSQIADKVGRGTVEQLYHQIFSDLTDAVNLLPNAPQLYKTRPSKQAAFAMLARVYLSIRNYAMSKDYADSTLDISSTLIDYNTLSNTRLLSMPPFPNNPEVIGYAAFGSNDVNTFAALIDTTLFNSYDSNDLRKTLYFKDASIYLGIPGEIYLGTYDGTYHGSLFSAPAIDEMYLIKAECNARMNNLSDAIADLNALLSKRYLANTYVEYSSTNQDSVISKIIVERKKELVMRGTRWTDLRRLNMEHNLATTIVHIYNNISYNLVPNSNQYEYPIPDDEILISGIPQNPR